MDLNEDVETRIGQRKAMVRLLKGAEDQLQFQDA